MSTAVRYYSRSGKTKEVAEAIAKAVGTTAISVDDPQAAISETSVLYLGGALYAYGLDRHLEQYIDALDASKVKKAVLFSTSWISKHALDLMRKKLESKGISVEKDTLYFKSKQADHCEAAVNSFVKTHSLK